MAFFLIQNVHLHVIKCLWKFEADILKTSSGKIQSHWVSKDVLPLKRLISMYCKKRPIFDNISISYYPIWKIFAPKCVKNTTLLESRLFLKISEIANETYSSLPLWILKSEEQFIIIFLENHIIFAIIF